MAKLFFTLFVRLDELTHNPDKLSSNIDWLCVALHKVLIAAHEVFDPHHRAALVANAVSTGASAAAAKSHAGRDALRKAACEKFMERESWASINEAADKIALELVKCKNVSRPLASNNAVRTVSEWVSKFIASNPKAKAHLTAAGQRRLKKK